MDKKVICWLTCCPREIISVIYSFLEDSEDKTSLRFTCKDIFIYLNPNYSIILKNHHIERSGLEKLIGLYLNIGGLDFRHCVRVDDSVLNDISVWKDLKRINLFGCYDITDDGLIHLPER